MATAISPNPAALKFGYFYAVKDAYYGTERNAGTVWKPTPVALRVERTGQFMVCTCNRCASLLRTRDCHLSTGSATGVGFHTVPAFLTDRLNGRIARKNGQSSGRKLS